jgi:hypothetical protein
MTRKKAIAQLKETKQLTTAMLKPLNISFESFLRFAQLPSDKCKQIIEQLIAQLEG